MKASIESSKDLINTAMWPHFIPADVPVVFVPPIHVEHYSPTNSPLKWISQSTLPSCFCSATTINLMKNLQLYFLEEQLTQKSLPLWFWQHLHPWEQHLPVPHFHGIPIAEGKTSAHFPPTPAPASALHGRAQEELKGTVGEQSCTCTQGHTALQAYMTLKCSWETEEIKCMRDSP